MSIPKRLLGNTGIEVTILGLGGEGILRTFGHDKQAYELINAALDLGINYLESARAYAGSESYYGRALGERRKDVFLTSKSHARDKKGALAHLSETLAFMRTDYLDLWQIHDVRTLQDVDRIFGRGGAIEAFVEAKEQGKVRYIGVTGHHDPDILQRCIRLFDFDTVLLPVNPAEPSYKSFLDTVAPLAAEKGMGIIGMKVYVRGFIQRIPWFTSVKPFMQFALSQPVSTVVIGCDSIAQLTENVSLARAFAPMSRQEQDALVSQVAPIARELAYYKP